MRLCYLTLINVYVYVIFNVLCVYVNGESGCPPPEDIAPCVCYNSPMTYLECSGMHSDSDIKAVFEKSKGYKYSQVHIHFSTLQYLPHEMFKNTQVQELYLQNSTLTALFDSPPEELHLLKKLHLEQTRIIELRKWNLFKPLENLQILVVYYNKVEILDSTFDENLTKDLKHIMFYGTQTKEILPGALTDFVNLIRLSFDGCQLTELSRDLFPRPFKVQHMYFNDNKITAIPEDLFTDMPNLRSLGMKNNYITMIPESAFGGRVAEMSYLSFEDNPLRCDCKLLWLIRNKPGDLFGTCSTPIRLHDKKLTDLTPANFKC